MSSRRLFPQPPRWLCLTPAARTRFLRMHQVLGGELLHVDTFAHNKSGIAYQSKNRRSETVVNHKREPLRQPRLPPNCTRSTSGVGQALPATQSASVIEPNCRQGAEHRGRQLLDSIRFHWSDPTSGLYGLSFCTGCEPRRTGPRARTP
jgi:hypothetical protein